MPTLKKLARIQSDDQALNRVQDQLAAALNPILRNVQGDLTGPLETPTVKGIRGVNVSAVTPTVGQTLIYSGSEWAPGTSGAVVTLSGDVTGPSTANTVEKIQGQPVSSATPATSDVLTWNGTQWAGSAPASVTLAGDVTGPAGSNTVEKIQNTPVSSTAPSTGDYLAYSGTQWAPAAPPAIIYPQQPAAWGNEYLWWKLNEANGSSSAANSGSAGTANLTGSPALQRPFFGYPGPYSVAARIRGGVTLKGSSGVYLSAGNSITVSAWATVNNTFTGAYYVVAKGYQAASTTDYTLRIYSFGEEVYYGIRTGANGAGTFVTATSPTNLVQRDEPTLFGMTYDGATLRGYINGIQVISLAVTGNIDWNTSSPNDWVVGGDLTNNSVPVATMYDVRIAAGARTAAQMLADYKTGAGYSY